MSFASDVLDLARHVASSRCARDHGPDEFSYSSQQAIIRALLKERPRVGNPETRIRRSFCDLGKVLEMDELWPFVRKKQKRLKPTDGLDKGDQYVFVGLAALEKG